MSYEVDLGMAGSFSDLVRVSIRVEAPLYEAAVAWLKDLIFGSEFRQDR